MRLRDPAHEAELRENATKALRALASYYEATRLVQPKRLVNRAKAILNFIRQVG